MGCSFCFCCLKNFKPECPLSIALAVNALSFTLLIWGIADIWFKRNIAKIFYYICLGIIIAILIFWNFIFIFLCCKRNEGKIGVNIFGRIFCIVVIILSIISFVLLTLATIFLIIDYRKDEYSNTHSKHWYTIYFPGIISLLAYIYNVICANYLYNSFICNSKNDEGNKTNIIGENSLNKIFRGTNNTVNVTVNNPNVPQNQDIPFYSSSNMKCTNNNDVKKDNINNK